MFTNFLRGVRDYLNMLIEDRELRKQFKEAAEVVSSGEPPPGPKYELSDIEKRLRDMSDNSKCAVCSPKFDPVAASGLSAIEVRVRWPRYIGACVSCGFKGIRYASKEHYVMGDW